jgi:fatty acid desaturase
MSLTTPPEPATSGYSALAGEIRRLGLMNRRPGPYAVMIAVNLVLLGGVVAGLYLLSHSWWLLLLAPAYSVVSTQIAFIGHDAAHRQIARSSRNSALIGLVHGNLLNGLSYGWWVAKHNAHHAHPNDLESDPDVAVGAFVFDHGQAAVRKGVGAFMTRHQAWLFFPMLLLEALNLHISSVRAVADRELRNRVAEGVLLAAHFGLYAALLATTMTWPQAAIFLVIHQGLFGLYLGCSFAPSHKGMPILSAEQAADPLLRQVLTARNIRSGRVLDFVLGGLNLQIEHHLFPSLPRPNLRLAQPAVQAFCERHGVSYAETTAFGAYASALRYLHDVGAELRDSQTTPQPSPPVP